MISLIDGDLITYRCAASCEKRGVVTEDLGIAQARASEMLHKIIAATSSRNEHRIFISGSENFRKTINPQYKANRDGVKRPEYLEPLREWIVVNWDAEISDGVEADDMLGRALTADPEGSICCSLDKDLRQVPGHHYSWEIAGTSGLGNAWVRPEERLIVSPMEGLFNFYWQLIMGDDADNIFGFDGKARKKVPKFLEPLYEEMQFASTERELFDTVRAKYDDDERFVMNGRCLWIQRHEGDDWLNRVTHIMGEIGQKDDTVAS